MNCRRAARRVRVGVLLVCLAGWVGLLAMSSYVEAIPYGGSVSVVRSGGVLNGTFVRTPESLDYSVRGVRVVRRILGAPTVEDRAITFTPERQSPQLPDTAETREVARAYLESRTTEFAELGQGGYGTRVSLAGVLAVAGSFAAPLLLWWVWIANETKMIRRRYRPGTCVECGYAMAGLLGESRRCPECGRTDALGWEA